MPHNLINSDFIERIDTYIQSRFTQNIDLHELKELVLISQSYGFSAEINIVQYIDWYFRISNNALNIDIEDDKKFHWARDILALNSVTPSEKITLLREGWAMQQSIKTLNKEGLL